MMAAKVKMKNHVFKYLFTFNARPDFGENVTGSGKIFRGGLSQSIKSKN